MPDLSSLRVVYFGTPQFAAEVLAYLLENQVQICAVVTQPDRPQGRGERLTPTPVKKVAQKLRPEIPIFQPEKASAEDFAETLKSFEADLFVVVAYGEIVKEHLLQMPKRACINLHASLLPKYRGAAPIQRCIIAGEPESGVTIMHMAKKMDAGDVIAMETTPITPEVTAGELEVELCRSGKELLLKSIADFAAGEPPRTVQDHEQATFAPKVTPEDGLLDFSKTATELHNQARGVTPRPGAWCKMLVRGQEKRLKVWKTAVESEIQGEPGEIKALKNAFTVACSEGGLRLIEVQLEGKRRMLGEELLRGYSLDDLRIS